LNARPGLNIQLANREGLLPRLNTIDSFKLPFETLSWGDRLEAHKRMLEALSKSHKL
jgi:hypothetical protein